MIKKLIHDPILLAKNRRSQQKELPKKSFFDLLKEKGMVTSILSLGFIEHPFIAVVDAKASGNGFVIFC